MCSMVIINEICIGKVKLMMKKYRCGYGIIEIFCFYNVI